MAALPNPLTYGVVTGRFVLAALDGDDEDDLPDSVPVTGTVTFTPNTALITVTSADPPVTIMASPITVPLVDGVFTAKLIATDNPATNPASWAYNVTFNFAEVSRQGFAITVPGGGQTDLTLVAPAPTTPGTVTVVSEATRVAAQLAEQGAVAAAARAEVAANRAETAAGSSGGGEGGGTGAPGASAYEVAVAEGFTGTASEWLDTLVGPTGPMGIPALVLGASDPVPAGTSACVIVRIAA